MSLALGAAPVTNLKVGDTQATRAYLGTVIVWQYGAAQTWTGAPATITVTGLSGMWAQPQVWTRTTTFVVYEDGDTVVWYDEPIVEGIEALIIVVGTSGTWSAAQHQTWTGTPGTVTVTGVSGTWVQAQTWTASAGTVTVAASSGTWSAAQHQTWTGTPGTVTVTGASGTWSVAAAGATFPSIATSSSEPGASLGAANPIPMPASVAVGDLLVAFAVNDNPSTTEVTASVGWTRILHITQGSNALRMAMFAKIAAGSDTLSVTGAAQDYCVSIHRIIDHAVIDVAADIATANTTGTTGNGDPPNLTVPAARHWLWLAAEAVDLSAAAQTITAIPSGYTAGVNFVSASSTSSCALAVASKQADATSENPATFTNNPTTRPWIGVTVGVPKDVVAPAAPALAAAPGNTQVTLTFTPASTGGAAITDYIIEWSADGTTGWTLITEATSATPSYTDTGLTNGVIRYYRVAAVNTAGTSGWSNVANATPGVVPAPVIDASSPALTTHNDGIPTTASFTPPAGSRLLCAFIASDYTAPTCTSSGLTFTTLGTHDTTNRMYFWISSVVPSATARTVAFDDGGGTFGGFAAAKVWVLTGVNATTPTGAVSATLIDTTNNWTATGYTSTAASSLGFAIAKNTVNPPSTASSTDIYVTVNAPAISENLWINKATASTGSGQSITFNADAGSATAAWKLRAVEVLP